MEQVMVRPDTATIERALDRLAELQAQRDAIGLQCNAEVEALLAPLKAQIDAVKARYESETAALADQIGVLTEAVKLDVLALGETVKGGRLMAVYSPPRVTWDGKRLDGYMKAHPEIEAFRKVGEPSVSFRPR